MTASQAHGPDATCGVPWHHFSCIYACSVEAGLGKGGVLISPKAISSAGGPIVASDIKSSPKCQRYFAINGGERDPNGGIMAKQNVSPQRLVLIWSNKNPLASGRVSLSPSSRHLIDMTGGTAA